jgi:C4-dicarboxylate-specific signal transduction histidine kinase
MKTSAIVALCVGVLLLGLAGIFFIIWFFFRKSKQEDAAMRQWQQSMMVRIDEAFPKLERLLQEGIAIPAPVADGEASAEASSRHQDDADAAVQRELEANSKAGATLFSSGGGFVS